MNPAELDLYRPSQEQSARLDSLLAIVKKATGEDLIVWVIYGYGLDALYGKLTRDHGDIDLAVDEKDFDRLVAIIKEEKFLPTSEVSGMSQKAVFRRQDLDDFKLELGTIQQTQKLTDVDLSAFMPKKPLGNLNGQPVYTPNLAGFKFAIKANDQLLGTEYLHEEWRRAIIKALEARG